MEQRKGKRQLNQGVRVKRTEEKEKRADRSAERTREATAVRAKRTTESRAARGAETSLGQKLKAIHGKVRKAVHESRERNFPESNGVAGQLLLLLCGLAAYWGALGREKLRLARRSHIRRTGGTSRAAKWRRKKYYPLAFGGAALVIALRILQGLALGGEYGGAAIYVAEHAPFGRRGDVVLRAGKQRRRARRAPADLRRNPPELVPDLRGNVV